MGQRLWSRASAPARAEAYKQALQEQLQPMVRTVELDRLEEQRKIMQAKVTTEALPLQNAPPRLRVCPVLHERGGVRYLGQSDGWRLVSGRV